MTVAEWTSVLKLATMWDFARIRQKAIENIQVAMKSQDPFESILLAEQFEVPEWELAALNALCQREEELTPEEGEKLGWRRALKVTEARGESRAVKRRAAMCSLCVLPAHCSRCLMQVTTRTSTNRSTYDFTPKLKVLLNL